MPITDNTVVQFEFEIRDDQGQILESSAQLNSPSLYLHGHNNIFPALEQALLGKEVGDKVQVQLTPEQAYGQAKPAQIERISSKQILSPKPLTPGMPIYIRTAKGTQQVRLVKKGLKFADVDTNHPWAGKNLHFDVQVTQVRPASQAELDHGHAHGKGGIEH